MPFGGRDAGGFRRGARRAASAARFGRPRHVWDAAGAAAWGDGEISIPPETQSGACDLVCIGSPTWWLKTTMPIRSFPKSDEAGRLLDGKPFAEFVVCRRYCRSSLSSATSARASTASATSA
jgi:hypothetical protein